MTVLDYVAPRSSGFLSRMGKGFMNAMYAFAEARSRSAEFQYYNDMSDEQLKEVGLRRDEIALHVFRHHVL